MAGEALTVAVVGATSLVGEELVRLLGERQVPVGDLRLLGSLRTAGRKVDEATIALVGPDAFDGVDVAFFAAGPTVAGEHVESALRAGAIVVDVSSRFRLDETVPLVVPEVNAHLLSAPIRPQLVASPSSTSVALSVVLGPLGEASGIRRVVVSTYQGAAGAGKSAVMRLSKESIDLLSGRGDHDDERRTRRAFNCIPQVGALEPGGATTHELQVVEEVRRVLERPDLAMHVTAARVPMFFGMAASIAVELEEPLSAEAALDVLRSARGILVHEDAPDTLPTPADVIGSQATHVGRVRSDPTVASGVALWVALDSIEKGAALNAVEIAEILLRGRT
ncbi:MAG TPA: aspartate-semialdehyde dehydrogenase [Candidatus Eisenbacteria bacterium]|nr:aspartate-semialdehyde dehydrogenase [Candidatus Eisenbacteria bacterium]